LNDRPILVTKPAPPLMLPTPPSPGVGPGQLVSALVKYATDVDGDTLGVAIARTIGAGTWQFSIDGGTNWSDFPAVSLNAALLLGPDDLVRFAPAAGAIGQAMLTFKAWDQSAGVNGTTANTLSKTDTSFCQRTATAITKINNAPVLAGSPVALAISENPT